jgi:DnaJ-class molecular chaperone
MQIRIDVNQDQTEDAMLDAPLRPNISVTIRLDDNGPFELRDNQLYTTAYIPANLLETGGNWTIPDPVGDEFTFAIPPNTPHGSILKLRRHGLRLGASPRRGHLYCTVFATN